MQRRRPSLIPTAVLLGVLSAMLFAAQPGTRFLEVVVSDADAAKFATAIIAAVASLLGALIGGGITGCVTYIIAKQNRLHTLEQDRQKARRERHTARVAPFLQVVDRRLLNFGAVIAAVRDGDSEEFEAAAKQAVEVEIYANTAIMPLARRQDVFGAALKGYYDAEGNARSVVVALVRVVLALPESATDPLVAARPLTGELERLTGELERAMDRLAVTIAELYDRLDDYLDVPSQC